MIAVTADEMREIRKRFTNFYSIRTKHSKLTYVEERADIMWFLRKYRKG